LGLRKKLDRKEEEERLGMLLEKKKEKGFDLVARERRRGLTPCNPRGTEPPCRKGRRKRRASKERGGRLASAIIDPPTKKKRMRSYLTRRKERTQSS